VFHQGARAERDACGIGFVADVRGRPSRSIVDAAIEALCRVRHRGAVGSDALTGDGAGLLLPLPRALLAPSGDADPERIGAAMTFLDPSDPGTGRRLVEEACLDEGLQHVEWRSVPTDPSALGGRARDSAPLIEQAVIRRPVGVDEAEGERRAFRARRRVEAVARAEALRIYVASLSFRVVTYKALCVAEQLAAFYPDLADDACRAWFAIFHQRYSTNTAPTWERAQPFRFLGHNGEINTIRGNFAAMTGRAGRLGASDLAPEELLTPPVDYTGSDSAMLDEAIELLVRGGRDLRHSVAMLVPQAWESVPGIPQNVREFFRYHACLVEPWDGPAGMVFSDGTLVGAALDRNGLRPLRVALCDDGLVACASEAGAVPTRGHGRVRRTRLGPGQMLCVDPAGGGVVEDAATKAALARRRPYGDWLGEHQRACSTGAPVDAIAGDLGARRAAAAYTKEEITVVLRPMATEGHEPTSSMGDDTPQPPLAMFPRTVFGYLKQRFAQVTNPAIDHLRERHVMSLTTRLGPRAPLLSERPQAAALREYSSFVLYPSGVADLVVDGAFELDATFDPLEGPDGLEPAVRALAAAAEDAASGGARHLILSQRTVGSERAAIPSALAIGAVHHRLLTTGLRSAVSVVVDCDDARETHHLACLLTIGADAICPRLVLETIAELGASGRLGGGVAGIEGQRRFVASLEDGVLKIMSKMGISVLDSYRGAQIIEAIGLAPEVVDLCFAGVASPIGGTGFLELGADVVNRHIAAFGARTPALANTGFIKHRSGGEHHGFNPKVVDALHESLEEAAHHLRSAVRGNGNGYGRFAALVEGAPPAEPRDLLEPTAAGPGLELEDVEPVEGIVRRFSTGAMSHGALSAEAHETLAAALNMIGGTANSGEGGEDPARYRTDRNCGIKQIASGRFGATPEYVVHARELQIKIAQGSKPGEGGQLPGQKVSVEIARLRHTVPGVALISPPPHHDIYSIEDLAQLIFDLKQANERAFVSVKLVSSEGVGTIAAGVVKGLADVVHIAGGDGGTGASPLSSIKNAGTPWEIGLADVQAALVANGLRGRARLRVDGGLKTGRDVIVAALLGADEYSFGTAALIAEGCILVRTCHRNTCPVGIATQDPTLRAKYAGTPEMVAAYLRMVAEDVRTWLARLGLPTLDDAIGRPELLHQKRAGGARADALDLAPLLTDFSLPTTDTAGGGEKTARRFTGQLPVQRPRSELGDRLCSDALAVVDDGRNADLSYTITTADRAVGARLGCELARRYGGAGPPAPVRARFRGEAGQSFGAWLSDGAELILTGEVNDYVCKSMSGGRVVIKPPANDAGDPCLAGNTVLYGATGGQLFVAGRAGERFAVRNSGAVAVVEGAGDHACEYMTAGAVVILGPTGRNLGAGMSGGEVYVFDADNALALNLNPQLVAAYEPTAGQLESLRRVIARHLDVTGSRRARMIVGDWSNHSQHFRRVAPVAEVARLEALFEGSPAELAQ
jgi:glutamate synthase domain-containing protein 2/glutamate synthase domain-containing protein 1/glutamate synthase domain-containing protein 3